MTSKLNQTLEYAEVGFAVKTGNVRIT